ncbi:cell division protein FtsZ [Pararhodobacter oceanensis]|uniref:Cell division protein FtsZ n=1 Tax=Pararhodobacter oceanensis TaxID=2172121 RepID=A0A2T8HWY6_9RHOB|nr:cell division protein FtsZ [Pararhodobacter oceanensis]PVH29914.1 cell division protein FtsZ [Pararhodobacter oceanensis]
MALNFIPTEDTDLTPRITVFGVGGAGGNAVNNMIEQNLEGVEFVVANTDAQALQQSKARSRIQLGVKVTEGLGAGARASVGASAAEETLEEIIDHLGGAHMCFITAGMGGGTGTGAAPIIAQAARELGVLTVGVVTKPFAFEGAKRMKQAEAGVQALQKVVDTLIIIPNQNLFRLANERTTFTEAFSLADDVLYQGVKGVTDLMVRPGMINLDFADVRAVMDEMGKAMMGTGEAAGEDRARQAAEKAIANPLLDEISLNGARGVLINITGGSDLTLFELDEAANLIRDKVDPEANIIVGSTLDDAMEGMIRVSVVATGIDAAHDAQSLDVQRRRLAEPLPGHAPAYEAEPEPQPVAEQDYGQDHGYNAPQEHYAPEPQAETYAEPLRAVESEPRYEPQYEARAEYQQEPRHEQRHEPRQEQPRAEFRAVPRQQTYAPQPSNHQPSNHQPSNQQPNPQQQAYGQAHGQAHGGAAPVQDEFDLDDVLGEQAGTPRTTVMVNPSRGAAPQPQHQQMEDAASFTAPSRQRSSGQPSPETLQRLREAVLKQPEQQEPRAQQQYEPRQEMRQQPQQHQQPQPQARQHAPQPVPQAAPQQEQAQERPRFGGLGGLIHRMAGSGGEATAAAPRQQPPIQAYDDEPQHRGSQDRIEIPAFLRRQAN